jgi:hypothetical protein
MVAAGAVAVLAVGGAALQDTQTQIDTDSAEKLFRTIDEEASDLERFSMASSTSVRVPDHLAGQVNLDHDAAWINVSVMPAGSDEVCDTGRINMGTVQYERDGEPVAVYQAGGIFKETNSGIAVASNPSVKYKQSNLQLRMLDFERHEDVPRKLVLANDPAKSHDETRAIEETLHNCLQNASSDDAPPRIGVEVHSQYASGWQQYFEDTYPDQNVTFENENTVKTVFDPDEQTESAPGTDLLCNNGEEGKYEWDVDDGDNRPRLRLICNGDDEDDEDEYGENLRIRYKYERLDGQDSINISVNSTHRKHLDNKYSNNTRWRFDQSTRKLSELKESRIREEGEWQTKDDDGEWDKEDNYKKDVKLEWERDDHDVDEFPSNLSMGPPDEIAGSLLRKHPYLDADNLKETPTNSPPPEDLFESLRESSTSSETVTFRPAEYVQIKVFQITSEDSQ